MKIKHNGVFMKVPFKINLDGKVVAVTGGSGVICAELCKALNECGAKIAIIDRNKEKADELANTLKHAKGYGCDILIKEQLVLAHKQIIKELGPIDILINGAGGNHPNATTDNEFAELGDKGLKSFFDLNEDAFNYVFDLNMIGTFLCTQEFAKDMVGKKGCSILNISSMNALTPLTKIPAYSSAKSAVSNFTKWLAVHFSHIGVRVNAIAPGFFSTQQNKALLWNEDETPTPRTHKILAATPMGRFGEVNELVGATLFLLSEEAAGFVTGVILPIDGGFSSYSGV